MSLHEPSVGLARPRLIEIANKAIADLYELQDAIKGVLDQDGNTDEDRQMLQRLLNDAQNDEKLARQDLEALKD
jgi:hypothetical protein